MRGRCGGVRTRDGESGAPRSGHRIADIVQSRWFVPAVALLAAVLLLTWWGWSHFHDAFHLAHWLEHVARSLRYRAHQLGPWGPILLIGLLAAHSVIVIFPMEIPTFAAFSLYGPVAGVAIVWTGSMTAAAISYLLGRILGPPILRYWAKNRKVLTLARVIGTLNPTELVLLRWISLIPYDALNLIFGTCEVPVLRFLWTTGLGVLVTNIAMVVLYDRALHAAWGQFIVVAAAVATAGWVAWRRGKALRARVKPK